MSIQKYQPRKTKKNNKKSLSKPKKHVSSRSVKTKKKPLARVTSPHSWKLHRDNWDRRSMSYKIKNRKNSSNTTLKNKIITFLVVGALLSIVIGAGMVTWISKDLPKPNTFIERDLPLSTQIYDRTGETTLFELHGTERRTRITLSDVPDKLKWATLVAEDRDFYKHGGIKITSIIRSVLTNIIKGRRAQGASTITQQFIKNAVLTTEKTYTRKIKEIILAWRLEKNFTKDEIFEMYFNEIPYGSVAYGAASASDIYFGKKLRELTLAESTILAALPKAPTYYSPYGSHKDALIERQQFILNQMVAEGYITQEIADKAKSQELEFKPLKGNIIAPHFVMLIREALAEMYGEKEVEQGGLQVITSLDLYKQEKAEEAIEKWGERNEETYNAKNASLVSIDPKTGEILAMVGSRDFFDDENDGQVNVSLRPRQPGSSFKPIVYATSFQQGLSPDTVLFDVKTIFKTDTDDYKPNNYNGEVYGPVTIRKSLAGSLNIPAVKTIYLTGINNVLDVADSLGYTTFSDRSRFGLSLVLGGGEVKLLEHTAAFGAFARDGVVQKPISILEISKPDGTKIFKHKTEKGSQALDSQVVRQINSILSDNSARAYVFGENNLLNLGARPVAAKTGTTNDNRDAWTIGYTPSLVTGVWVGNNNFSKMSGRAVGASVAAPIWHQYMREVLGDTPVEKFKEPKKTKLSNKPMLNGKIGQEEIIKIDRITGKRATKFTPKETIEEKTFRTLHSILHYVTPRNILGPPPNNPSRDKNYATWEEGVKKWAEENDIEISERPPDEYDDLHTQNIKPSIQITEPKNNHIYTSTQITVRVNTTAPRGVKKVEYYIDDKKIQTINSHPFALKYTFEKIPNGAHTLKAIAYDDISNNQSTSIDFTLNLSEELVPFTTTWIKPQNNNTTVLVDDFPLPLLIEVDKPEKVKKADFYYKPTGAPLSQWLGFKNETQNTNQYASIWEDAPDPGEYILYAILSDTEGDIVRSEEIEIIITE